VSARARTGRKRRAKRTLRARVGTYWILGTIVACAFAWGMWTLATLPAFRLHDLAVTGTSRVARADVVRLAAIDPHENVWLLDRGAIERRVETIPFVLTAVVHRRPLGSVWLDVTERAPEACVLDRSGNEALVDVKLRVLSRACAGDANVTYAIRGTLNLRPGAFVRDPEVAALQSDAHALSATGDRYRSFAHDGYGELEAVLPSGIEIRFGDDDDLARKQRLIAPILAEVGPRLRTVRSVDVRAPSTPVVEFRK